MKSILITGYPGVGKTTLIRGLRADMQAWDPIGFYTQEIRESGVRKGFEWVDLKRGRGVLSHVDLESPHRVGKYGVDLEGFEKYLESLYVGAAETRLVVIDEIGKMECLSAEFRGLVLETLDSDKVFIATIAMRGTAFTETIKRRNDVVLYHLTRDSRDSLRKTILRRVCGSSD